MFHMSFTNCCTASRIDNWFIYPSTSLFSHFTICATKNISFPETALSCPLHRQAWSSEIYCEQLHPTPKQNGSRYLPATPPRKNYLPGGPHGPVSHYDMILFCQPIPSKYTEILFLPAEITQKTCRKANNGLFRGTADDRG